MSIEGDKRRDLPKAILIRYQIWGASILELAKIFTFPGMDTHEKTLPKEIPITVFVISAKKNPLAFTFFFFQFARILCCLDILLLLIQPQSSKLLMVESVESRIAQQHHLLPPKLLVQLTLNHDLNISRPAFNSNGPNDHSYQL
jgi:hypothetical protein